MRSELGWDFHRAFELHCRSRWRFFPWHAEDPDRQPDLYPNTPVSVRVSSIRLVMCGLVSMPRHEIHLIMYADIAKEHASKGHFPHHAPSPATRPACMQIQTWLPQQIRKPQELKTREAGRQPRRAQWRSATERSTASLLSASHGR